MLSENYIDELLLEISLMIRIDLTEHINIKPHNAWIIELVVVQVILIWHFSYHDFREAIMRLLLGDHSKAEIRKQKYFFFFGRVAPRVRKDDVRVGLILPHVYFKDDTSLACEYFSHLAIPRGGGEGRPVVVFVILVSIQGDVVSWDASIESA